MKVSEIHLEELERGDMFYARVVGAYSKGVFLKIDGLNIPQGEEAPVVIAHSYAPYGDMVLASVRKISRDYTNENRKHIVASVDSVPSAVDCRWAA